MLVEVRSENRPIIRRNYNDSQKDRQGNCSASLIGDLRFFGVAAYVLRGDVSSFKAQLSEAAAIREEMFDRLDHGEPIDPSYNSVLAYNDVLNGLAAGSFEIAAKLARRVIAMPMSEQVHQFDEKFGRALCATLLSANNAQSLNAELGAWCLRGDKDFAGYSLLFDGALTKDLRKANEGLVFIAKSHSRQTRKDGVFADSEDEVLSVWGIGVANLARHLGVNVVSPNEELIPSQLLV